MIDASWLRTFDVPRLAALLRQRPDLAAAPTPGSLTELAQRLTAPLSVIDALRQLGRPALQVVEALAALGGECDRVHLLRLLGAGSHTADEAATEVDRALAVLRDQALLIRDEPLQLVDAARQAWEHPLGLGPPVAELAGYRTADELRAYARNLDLPPGGRKAELLARVVTALRDPQVVCRVVTDAPAAARELLHRVAVTGEPIPDFDYFSPHHQKPKGPRQWAVAHGLLIRPADWNAGLLMPAEVALALRGPQWSAPFDPTPPRTRVRPVAPATVAHGSAAAGAAMLRLVGALLDEAGKVPIATLKTGGVGVRELHRLTKQTGGAPAEVRLALALAHRAGLLVFTTDGGTPTTGYDDWLRGEPAERLAPLIHAWWSLPYPPTDAGDAAFVPAQQSHGISALRSGILGTAAALSSPDQPVALVDPADLVDLVLWQTPYVSAAPDPRQQGLACWQEAAMLGLVGAGGVSAAGRALTDGGDVAGALTDLGTTEGKVRIQADLTAIVAGTPSARLATLLDGAAEREARGAANTWRFTPASVRRALDSGEPAEELLAELAAVAIGGVPQPLEYLVRDVARRHGVIRGQEVACCLRADDSALLAEIAADRQLRDLGLRLLAPTVLAGAKPLADTLARLRMAGYAPLAENADGTPVLERMPRRRAAPTTERRNTRPPLGAPPVSTPSPSGISPASTASPTPATDPEELARALLDAPDVVAPPPSPSLSAVLARADRLAEGQARILAHAIDAGLPVSIQYVNQAGNFSSRVIQEIELSGGTLLAWCRLRADGRMFNLSRILSVAPASAD